MKDHQDGSLKRLQSHKKTLVLNPKLSHQDKSQLPLKRVHTEAARGRKHEEDDEDYVLSEASGSS